MTYKIIGVEDLGSCFLYHCLREEVTGAKRVACVCSKRVYDVGEFVFIGFSYKRMRNYIRGLNEKD